jgi:hypothetical protein
MYWRFPPKKYKYDNGHAYAYTCTYRITYHVFFHIFLVMCNYFPHFCFQLFDIQSFGISSIIDVDMLHLHNIIMYSLLFTTTIAHIPDVVKRLDYFQ